MSSAATVSDCMSYSKLNDDNDDKDESGPGEGIVVVVNPRDRNCDHSSRRIAGNAPLIRRASSSTVGGGLCSTGDFVSDQVLFVDCVFEAGIGSGMQWRCTELVNVEIYSPSLRSRSAL